MSNKRKINCDDEVKVEKAVKHCEPKWWWKANGLEYTEKEDKVTEIKQPKRIFDLKTFLQNYLTPVMEKDD